ncbi:MAG: NADH-quinone oxidoreductase subunit NuoH [Chloroflexi bacterium]|nr:NADH-quinone oxidoreductase subunit NuoH [Chloroflexota bacterium]
MFGPSESSVVVQCASSGACTVLHAIFTSGFVFFVLLTGFAYTTLLERRFLAALQSRVGPNRAGPFGMFQPVADGIKLIFKEDVTPSLAKKAVFWLSPVIKVVPAIIVVAVIPFGPDVAIPWFDGKWYRVSQSVVDVNIGVLWLLAITSVGIYGIVLAGWSSNNKYAMLGGLRSSAQMISYELSMGLVFVVPVMLASSMSVGEIIEAQNKTPVLGWFVFQNPLAATILLVALLAEVNRAPFDMPEAEQELTAGYHSEYSGMKFALFFMAEYIGMVAVSMISVALYFGGYHFLWVDQAPLLGPVFYGAKVFILLLVMVWVRGTLPRIRYDRLMLLGWKVMLPLALVAVVWSAVGVVLLDEIGQDFYAGMSVAGIVLFVLGSFIWLSRAGRKPDISGTEPRVEVVSLSGNSGLATTTLRAVDRVIRAPAEVAERIAARETPGED